MGNVPTNDDDICCEVGDWFKGGYNYGSTVIAARYIKEQAPGKVSWGDFVEYVDSKGGFLSEELKTVVHELWNLGGNMAYSHSWSQGLKAVGSDENGLIWVYDGSSDYREKLLESIIQ